MLKLYRAFTILIFRRVEEVKVEMASDGFKADNTWIPVVDLGNDTSCRSQDALILCRDKKCDYRQ